MLFTIISSILIAFAATWTTQQSKVSARLRGVSAVNERIAWASGSSGTVLKTTDGGDNWQKVTVTSDNLDFRDIDAVSDQVVYVLSVGNGPASRIYKTVNAGKSWTLQFTTDDTKAFLDAMSFWDAKHGIVFGDSVDGQLYVMTTEDGGQHWTRVDNKLLPPALENEGAFAASGTNIAVVGSTHAWIGTGAGSKARVLRTADRGRTWQVADTPLLAGKSAGIFSVAFRDLKHGVIVGGDYAKESEAVDNVAITDDGGATWQLVRGLRGFRSVVAYVPSAQAPTLIALGPSGGDISTDDGHTWKGLECPGVDTFSFARGRNVGWGSGAKGIIAKLSF